MSQFEQGVMCGEIGRVGVTSGVVYGCLSSTPTIKLVT